MQSSWVSNPTLKTLQFASLLGDWKGLTEAALRSKLFQGYQKGGSELGGEERGPCGQGDPQSDLAMAIQRGEEGHISGTKEQDLRGVGATAAFKKEIVW